MPARFSEVIPDLLYRGGAPDPLEIDILKDKWKIEQIISLDEQSGEKIKEACKKNNIKQIILPIHKHTNKNREDIVINKINELGVSNIINNIPSYVHCKHGKDRTGAFIGRYRTENGWDGVKALEEAISFGFALGVDDDSANNYIKLINNGKYCKNKIKLQDVKDMHQKFNEICLTCGSLKTSDSECFKCENNKSASSNLVDIARYDSLHGFQNPGSSTSVSNLWDPQRGFELWNIEGNMATASYDKKTRKGLIHALNKVSQELTSVTQNVSDVDKKETKDLIKNLDTLLNLIEILIDTQIVKFINLFKNNTGINSELIKEIKAENYFIYLGKNLKKNIWKLIGNRYIDLVEDIDENKEQKKHDSSKAEDEDFFTLFDICLKGLSKFNKDTHIGPMQKSLEESIKNLADLIVKLSDFIEDNLDSEEFPQHFLTFLESIQKQNVTIKKLIKDRIIYSLNKEVLGKEKIFGDNKDINVLKEIINQ